MIFVCANCEGGTALAAMVEAATGQAVRLTGCMNACARAPALAVRVAGREAYLFGPVGAAEARDMPAFLQAYDAAPGGRIADATGLPALRQVLIGRIPAA